MNKFALLQVGINTYPYVPLRGCVNDCRNLAEQFAKFSLTPSLYQKLFDADATRKNILDRLRWLVQQDVPTLIFQYSGHGTRLRDRDGDESSHYDSAIVPVDFDSAGVILDDELVGLYALVPPQKRLIILSDSCHSGKSQRAFITRWKSKLFRASTPRFLPENLIPELPEEASIQVRKNKWLRGHGWPAITRRKSFLENSERCLLISTCKEEQTSADACIGGQWQGAGTASLIWAWSQLGIHGSYGAAADWANRWLKSSGYDQVLRVEGRRENFDKPFFT